MLRNLTSGFKPLHLSRFRLTFFRRSVSDDSYETPAIRTPGLAELQKISNDCDLRLSDEELQQYQKTISNTLSAYDAVYRLTEPQLMPVKYPRNSGYRPQPEDNEYNAWYWKCEIKGSSSGKLQGKTVAIKDNIAVAGIPMMNGSRILEGYTPEFDASIVTRILDAGGIITGKSVVPELCFSSGGYSAFTGQVENPHKKGYSPGGSSSGSAALIAGGCVDLALGGDQGGSVRIPSCWCGIAGLKPTHGLVPYTGAMPIEPSIDHLGPMAKTVYDCALLLEVIAGNDGLDPRQPTNIKVPEYTKQLTENLKDVKIGLVKEGFELSDEDVAKSVYKAANKLKDCGANVEEISIPMHKKGLNILMPIIVEGGNAVMISGCGYGYGRKDAYSTSLISALHRGYKTHIHESFATIKLTILMSEYIHKNHGNFFYAKAQNLARVLSQTYNYMLNKYDVLVMPTLTSKPQKFPNKNTNIPELCDDALGYINNTAPFNATGHPALNVNSGFISDLPIGMMIIGKHFDDATVLKVGHAFEKLK